MPAQEVDACPECGREFAPGATACPACEGSDRTAPKRNPTPLIVLLVIAAGLAVFGFMSRKPDIEVFWVGRDQGRARGEIRNLTENPLSRVFVVAQYDGPAPEGTGSITLETFPFPIYDASKPMPRARRGDAVARDADSVAIPPGKTGAFTLPLSVELVRSFRFYVKEGDGERTLRYVEVADREPTTPPSE
jgi:hypothetical protein